MVDNEEWRNFGGNIIRRRKIVVGLELLIVESFKNRNIMVVQINNSSNHRKETIWTSIYTGDISHSVR